jgi:hypothetical protein
MAKLITKNTDGHLTITPNVVKGYEDIKNSLIIGTLEFEVKTLVFFWQDEYSDKLKKANERIKELEYCIKTMKTVK